jgi:hypothetical protein
VGRFIVFHDNGSGSSQVELLGTPLGARLRAGIARGWKGVEP